MMRPLGLKAGSRPRRRKDERKKMGLTIEWMVLEGVGRHGRKRHPN